MPTALMPPPPDRGRDDDTPGAPVVDVDPLLSAQAKRYRRSLIRWAWEDTQTAAADLALGL